jgi:hypothetical protein
MKFLYEKSILLNIMRNNRWSVLAVSGQADKLGNLKEAVFGQNRQLFLQRKINIHIGKEF